MILQVYLKELPQTNGEIGTGLHDFNPKRIYQNKLKLVIYSWLGIFLVVTASYLKYFEQWLWIKNLRIILSIFLGILFLYYLFLIETGKIANHWDEMDYTPFDKRDFGFTADDGSKHFAYIYIPKGLDVNNLEKPLPAIIGLHGWGSHHHEMDRYCLPAVQKLGCLYFTFDAFGHGQTPGDANDLRQFDHARDFIDLIHSLPYVDKKKIGVVAMSLGAAKASVVAYPNPKVRTLVFLSGPFNLSLTKQTMTNFERFLFSINGLKLEQSVEALKAFSGIDFFNPEGIKLEGESQPTPNHQRVFLLANADDPAVKIDNTLSAVEKLQLPPNNYRIFPNGKHIFQTNEVYVSGEIYEFLRKFLSQK